LNQANAPDTVLQTYACLNIGGTGYDWNLAGFGPLGFVGALTWSSDTFFYQIGGGVGGPTLIGGLVAMVLGKKTGLNWHRKKQRAWSRMMRGSRKICSSLVCGDSINMSIGQGFLQVTPLQYANVLCSC